MGLDLAGDGGLLEPPGLAFGGDWLGGESGTVADAEAFIGCARLAAAIDDDKADLGGGCGWLGGLTAGCPLGRGGDMEAGGRLAKEDKGTPAPGLIVAEAPCPAGMGSGCRWLARRAVGSDAGADVLIVVAVLAGAGGDAGSTLALAGRVACLAGCRLETDSACWPGCDATAGSDAEANRPLALTGLTG
ncbi:hypothetical protein [Thiorhodovibrio frisius]|uniref:Uncharacterized protein n=1 Tax=Thiorhodovibrio frisius TaxID=631362 RepID=H8YVK5_9GAMM|nr:hypothetical protein [Thiorhodovibrio frisius]EIC23945.1 hypothetical protein Thi970DRAFT_00080 [Thiorhodovibrio frisius]WPL23019.1 hypothetical protein Thiofri_03199 [Thiorhodovibrio frisius]